MKIEKITASRVKKLTKETDYLVWQGCGGPLEDWVEGIEKLLIDSDCAKKNYKLKQMYVFDNGGLTNIIIPLDKLNLAKLACMRLMWRETFGTMWLSDYVGNHYI